MVKSNITVTVVGKEEQSLVLLTQYNPVHLLTFKDGGVLVEFSEELKKAIADLSADHVWLNANIRDSDGLIALPSIVAFIRSLNTSLPIRLNMPYLPHARQDRYTGNNAFTFKHSVVPIINECNFQHISVMDAHNPSMLALFNAPSVYNSELINQIPDYWKDDFVDVDMVVAPDAGAVKNSEKYAKYLSKPLGTASKSRDPNNGYIVYNAIYGDSVEGKTVLVVDDLIEGGATVRLLAEKLKEQGAAKVLVAATHGLFPKGFEHLRGAIDHIYTYYCWLPADEVPEDFVEVGEYF